MKDDATLEVTMICCMAVVVVWLFSGCASIKYEYTSYYPEGGVQSETKAKYFRSFNQKIEVGNLKTELFEARIKDQEADNDEIVESISSGVVAGIGKVVKP